MQNIDLKSSGQIVLWSSVETQSRLEGATGHSLIILLFSKTEQNRFFKNSVIQKTYLMYFKHAHCKQGRRER